ncbi:PDGLE domain-containing protein [Nocardioides guangzhouensis]|uniref:PDGLE domain-containing protein n=1 Tax=Nocardioides guangzhouensis TaxID=2497878 RepID=UPI0014386AE8|nr:PDGLE domain-containing protein [Nocardioides guangzhouensis]
MSRKTFLGGFLLVVLLIAGGGSYYASSHPDGLEHVAETTGFGHTAGDSAASDSPFAGYSTKGVDDARLSGGIAGVAGALVVLLLAGGLAWAVRRRGGRPDDQVDETTAGQSDEHAGERRVDSPSEA